MDLRERYLEIIQSNLKRYSSLLYLELEEFLSLKFSPEIDFLDFIILNTINGTDLMVYSMNLEGEEVCGSYGETCFAGSEKLMENLALFKLPDDFESDDIHEDYPDLKEKEWELVKNWFLQAFIKANGQNKSLRSFLIIEEDYDRVYDLQKEKTISRAI